MRFSRFERKILAAIAAVAIVPMVGALVLGLQALREAYQVGVNAQVRQELERGLETYREHFVALRHGAEQLSHAVANDWELREAVSAEAPDAARLRARLSGLLELHDNLARVEVRRPGGEPLASAEAAANLDDSMRQLELSRPVDSAVGELQVVVTVATPVAPFRNYQRAGEVVEVFSKLERGTGVVSGFYLVVYMGFLLSVIVMAMGVGIVISRRVTRRVAVLAEATERVGSGDLSVEVPSDVNDEIGELTHAFNEMVRDIRESRGRIEYLQRIGAWQEFARRLAHEIKNPLTPIQLAVQEIHRSYDGDDPEFRQRLDAGLAIVHEEVATLRRLVGEFSAFAKLPEASLEAADLNDFLREVSRSLETTVDEYRNDDTLPEVRVECIPSSTALPVEIDAMMLKRGLDNLVRNSLQAMRDEATRRAAHVRVETRRESNLAVIEVQDDGPGIGEAARERIFDPYYTTKSDGTGLGLAIVKKVVLEHGGEIRCEDGDLGGIAFSIRLPIRSD